MLDYPPASPGIASPFDIPLIRMPADFGRSEEVEEEPPLDLSSENSGEPKNAKNSCSYKKSLLKRYSKSIAKLLLSICHVSTGNAASEHKFGSHRRGSYVLNGSAFLNAFSVYK